jgi:hypothetical protein
MCCLKLSKKLLAVIIVGSIALLLVIYRYSCPTVSLSQLEGFAGWYHGTDVRVKATAFFFYKTIVIREIGCDLDCPAAVVPLDDLYKPSAEVEALINDSATREYQTEVIVVGRFDQDYTQGCYGPRFGIIAKEIELASTVIAGETLPKLTGLK